MTLKIQQVEYHRNGVGGEGFHVIRFKDHGKNMLASVFGLEPCGSRFEHDDCSACEYFGEGSQCLLHSRTNGRVAVFDVDLLTAGEIRMGYNSWRGDEFERELREAILAEREAFRTAHSAPATA